MGNINGKKCQLISRPGDGTGPRLNGAERQSCLRISQADEIAAELLSGLAREREARAGREEMRREDMRERARGRVRDKLKLPRQLLSDVASCVLVLFPSLSRSLSIPHSLSFLLSCQLCLSCCALSFLVAEAAATFLVAPFDFMALFSAACSVNLGKAVVAGFFMSLCVCI